MCTTDGKQLHVLQGVASLEQKETSFERMSLVPRKKKRKILKKFTYGG
jgi:hypothetical protein